MENKIKNDKIKKIEGNKSLRLRSEENKIEDDWA